MVPRDRGLERLVLTALERDATIAVTEQRCNGAPEQSAIAKRPGFAAAAGLF
jgi:hypothetical protein